MAEQFGDLTEFLDPTLPLPIAGTVYEVPAVDAETGLRLQALWEAGVAASQGEDVHGSAELDDLAERDLYRDALGPAFEQMVAARVPWPWVKHAAQTAFVWNTAGRDAALAHWRSPGKRQARKQPGDHKPATGKRAASKRTAAASKTRARASTAGTTSRKGGRKS